MALDAAVHEPAERGEVRGVVVQVHGINADMAEGGMFIRLADRLAGAGFAGVRFSFRGHGRSDGTDRGATIAGEMLDLQSAVDWARERYSGGLSLVSASFGAVAACTSLPYLDGLDSLVLWNPVLDPEHTFTDPQLPWGRENFGPAQRELLRSQGFLRIDGTFRMGRVMFEETRHYRPLDYFLASRVPSLIVHGDRDSAVSYDIAKDTAGRHFDCAFHTVAGSDHGFDGPEHENEAIETTAAWLTRR